MGRFDSDAHVDIALAAYSASLGSAVLFGDGNGGLTNTTLATTWATSATGADFNGDGMTDVAITQDSANNVKLSTRRADSVRKWLVNKGVDPARVSAVGKGPDQPIAPNNNKENRAKNRRIEFVRVK
jgi:hypothetical protein